MKLVVSLAVCVLGASSLFANTSLIEKAKTNGLQAIPSSEVELMKLN